LQAISYAITREKAPIYTMGSADPRAYSRYMSTAGNLIWINFDRHALLNFFHKARGPYGAEIHELRPPFSLAHPERTGSCRARLIARTDCRSVPPGLSVLPATRSPRAYARATNIGERRSADRLRFQDRGAAGILTTSCAVCSCGFVAVTGVVTSICILCCSGFLRYGLTSGNDVWETLRR
jgi:hypothetical protein